MLDDEDRTPAVLWATYRRRPWLLLLFASLTNGPVALLGLLLWLFGAHRFGAFVAATALVMTVLYAVAAVALTVVRQVERRGVRHL